MGPSSAFGGAFGGNPPMPVGPDSKGTGEVGQTPNDKWPWLPNRGPIKNPNGPFTGGAAPPTPAPTSAPPGNVLGPQAVRASGDSKGFDPSYLQNLATAIGGLFSNSKQGGNVMNINPLGNLSEISGSSGMEGNAPQQGLPLTWLQRALNGLGFSWQPPAPPPMPTGPDRSGGGGGYGGDNGRGGGRRFNLQ
jgi:hypothetical protein